MLKLKNLCIFSTFAFAIFSLLAVLFPGLLRYGIGIWFVTFHAILEFTAAVVIVGCGVYIILHRKFIGTSRNIFLAFCLITSGILDTFHALSYGGMPETIIFPSLSTSYYFWLAARIITGGGLLSWSILKQETKNKYSLPLSFAGAGLIICSIYISVDYFNQSLPLLNSFFGSESLKKVVEYFIITVVSLFGFIEWYKEKAKRGPPFYYFFAFVSMAILSEIYNILTPTNFDLYNVFSHIFKITSYIFLFQALYQSSKNISPFANEKLEIRN